VADFLKPPVVDAIDVSGYHGAIGDVIAVRAMDDFEVASVTVVLRDAANAIVEQGAATHSGGLWHYPATVALAAGAAITIEAIAKDRPLNEGRLSMPLTVA
jgi:hypothetical protein